MRIARQGGPVHADRGRQVGSAGPDVVELDDQRAGRVRRAQTEGVEGVPLRADLLPDAELTQHAQRVALQGDPGAERGDVGLDVDQVDGDTGSASRMAVAVPAAPAPTTRRCGQPASGAPLLRERR